MSISWLPLDNLYYAPIWQQLVEQLVDRSTGIQLPLMPVRCLLENIIGTRQSFWTLDSGLEWDSLGSQPPSGYAYSNVFQWLAGTITCKQRLAEYSATYNDAQLETGRTYAICVDSGLTQLLNSGVPSDSGLPQGYITSLGSSYIKVFVDDVLVTTLTGSDVGKKLILHLCGTVPGTLKFTLYNGTDKYMLVLNRVTVFDVEANVSALTDLISQSFGARTFNTRTYVDHDLLYTSYEEHYGSVDGFGAPTAPVTGENLLTQMFSNLWTWCKNILDFTQTQFRYTQDAPALPGSPRYDGSFPPNWRSYWVGATPLPAIPTNFYPPFRTGIEALRATIDSMTRVSVKGVESDWP